MRNDCVVPSRSQSGRLMKIPARTGVSGIAWAIAPAGVLFVLFFALPFGVMAVLSLLSGNPVSNPNVAFTARNYARLIDSDLYFDALIATLRIGVVTTALALAIGYPLAHWMARMRSRLGHALLLMAVIAPMLPGIVVGLVHIYVPFMVLTLVGVIGRIDPALEEAARNLGAGRARTFLEVTLPLSLPGILAGSLLVFALAIDR